mmetsp:Transcript_3448/g.11293  ORF Transcript_3448/g.11293 Transcript_3448/m.11293 type:complete len:177 (-) Transcript_3448:115-645(-)
MVVGRHLPCSVLDVERVRRFIYRELDPLVAAGEFVVVYCHAETSWKDSPGLFWLRGLFMELPAPYHAALRKLLVLHPGLALHALAWVVGPQWGLPRWLWSGLADLFWNKLEFVARVEFLWDAVPQLALPALPDFITEHDAMLEGNPLLDYGVAAAPVGSLSGYGGGGTVGSGPPIM